MKTEAEILSLIGQPENEQLEYKAVLPPSRNIAQQISAFANSKGGLIILGVSDRDGKVDIIGLSEDFRASAIVHKAIDLLNPKPKIQYFSTIHEGKKLYVIEVESLDQLVTVEGKAFVRNGLDSTLKNPSEQKTKSQVPKIEQLSKNLHVKPCTTSLRRFYEHFLSILNISNDLGILLYPNGYAYPTTNSEGRILMRILFSSCADTFENYLADLLYEIYLAKPETLKSEETVTVKEVLDCADIQEFISFFARKKLSKLKKGSVKGFLSDNKQIEKLKAVNEQEQVEIEKLLQIRHLYSHNNGVIDEKFLDYFPDYKLNDLHEMSIDKMIDYMSLLAEVSSQVDRAALLKFKLAPSI